MAHYGYLRVSTTDQTTENQRAELEKTDIKIAQYFTDDGVSGNTKATERPAFRMMLEGMSAGDIIVVTKVDRLGRSASDVLDVVKILKERSISLKIVQLGAVDILSPVGKMIFTMLTSFAEMERDFLVERTRSGLARTKAQGTKLGPPLTIEPSLLRKLVEGKAEGLSLDKLSDLYGVPRNTIHRNVTQWAGKMEQYEAEWAARQQQYAAKAA